MVNPDPPNAVHYFRTFDRYGDPRFVALGLELKDPSRTKYLNVRVCSFGLRFTRRAPSAREVKEGGQSRVPSPGGLFSHSGAGREDAFELFGGSILQGQKEVARRHLNAEARLGPRLLGRYETTHLNYFRSFGWRRIARLETSGPGRASRGNQKEAAELHESDRHRDSV